MTGAFFYLTVCSMRNRLRVRVKRLREPRYLIGLIAGGLYFYTFFFRRAFSGGKRGSTGSMAAALALAAGPVQFLGSVVLFTFAALAWLWPGSRPALLFTRAEVQFLFQAPLTRRQLVHYKLIRTQVATVFGSAITTVFLRPTSLANGWMFLVGLWLAFSTISLHLMGISLSRQSVTKLGVVGLVKQWVPFAVVIGAVGVLVATVALDWPRLVTFSDFNPVLGELQRIASTGPAAVVLWPFRAIARVPMSASPAEFWRALPWALGILAANYAWVLQADAAFEEAAAARAEKVAKRVADVRAGKLSAPSVKIKATTTPFTLALQGRPEAAILWKNLIMVGRYASLKMLIRIVPLVIIFGMLATKRGNGGGVLTAVAIICMVCLFVTIVLGPQMVRNDLRQDLANLAVLKTWPISGAALVRGELLAPAVTLSAVAWLFILGALMLAGSLPLDDGTAATIAMGRVSYAVAAAFVAPGLILAQLVVQNGLAIMFPAWVTVGTSRAQGIEATGQRLLMMAGNLLALILSLLPGVIIGGGLAVAVYATTGVVLVVLPAMILGITLLAESWLAVEALGRVLARTDVTAIGPVE